MQGLENLLKTPGFYRVVIRLTSALFEFTVFFLVKWTWSYLTVRAIL